jgi:hypothetical protein
MEKIKQGDLKVDGLEVDGYTYDKAANYLDTKLSFGVVITKINEIIDVLNKKECCTTIKFNEEGLKKYGEFKTFDLKKDKEGTDSICKKCVYQRVVTCDKCSDESIAGEDIDAGKAVFKSKTDGKIYMVKEDWEKEFDEKFPGSLFSRTPQMSNNGVFIQYLYVLENERIKQFIRNLLK